MPSHQLTPEDARARLTADVMVGAENARADASVAFHKAMKGAAYDRAKLAEKTAFEYEAQRSHLLAALFPPGERTTEKTDA